jgi:hypothetical protein
MARGRNIHLFNRSCVMRSDLMISLEGRRAEILELVAKEFNLEPSSVRTCV